MEKVALAPVYQIYLLQKISKMWRVPICDSKSIFWARKMFVGERELATF